MINTAANSFNQTTHRQVWELLPWYVNCTLSEQETLEVQDHLAECLLCQAELNRCKATAAVVRSADDTDWVPSTQQFNTLLAQLERTEKSPVSTRWTRLWQTFTASWESLRIAPPAARWVLAGQAALLVIASGLIALQFATVPGEPYRTLSNPVQPVADTVRVHAVFADDLSMGELRKLLLGLQVTIVQGPTSQGVYTVAMSADSNPAAAQTRLLDALRIHPRVLLAEPVMHEAQP
jgi:hypothetical protein